MVLDASLLNTQHYKVRIKGKVEQSREGVAPSPTHWCSSYRKGSLRVTLDYGRQLYFLLILANKVELCDSATFIRLAIVLVFIFISPVISSNIHCYSNIFQEFNVLKEVITTETFIVDFHYKFIKFWRNFSTILHSFEFISLFTSIYIYIYIYIYIHMLRKLADCRQGRPEGPLYNSYYTEV